MFGGNGNNIIFFLIILMLFQGGDCRRDACGFEEHRSLFNDYTFTVFMILMMFCVNDKAFI